MFHHCYYNIIISVTIRQFDHCQEQNYGINSSEANLRKYKNMGENIAED